MTRHPILLAILIANFFPMQSGMPQDTPATQLVWEQLSQIPAAQGKQTQPGVAGPFVGSHNGVVILAGGANFPNGLPWEKGPKVYHKDVFVLSRQGETWEWRQSATSLPGPIGYGAMVSHSSGIICMGGEYKDPPVDGTQTRHLSDKVFSLKWVNDKVLIDDTFPNLPKPMMGLVAARIGDVIYAAAGDSGNGPTTNFWSLDLSKRGGADYQWKTLPAWPGKPRVLPQCAAQSDGASKKFFLFSGRNSRGDVTDYLTDAWQFDPGSKTWEQLPDVLVDGQPRCTMAGTATAVGIHHILIIGGADGKLFQRLAHDLPAAIKAAEEDGDTAEKEKLEKEKLGILNNHPGFSKDVLAYHTITRTWIRLGAIEGDSPVTTGIAKIDDRIIIPSGEKSPGIRTTQALSLQLKRETNFGGLNYAVLGIYLAGVLLNGLYFSRKMKTTDDFFKAGSRIPWWAAGISIFGTQLSAITFIAIPAKVYGTDWRLFVGQLAIIMVAPFIIHLFLPFYRRLNVTTAYEYLEKRFNVFVRCFGSVMFMLLQFARIGIVLYLPSIALSIVTGMSVDLCILLMGVMCIIYTVFGGMEAVIWTDVTQVVILAGGALLCLILIPMNIPGGWNGMVEIADEAGKYRLLDFRWAPGTTAFIIVLLGSLSGNLISYGTDQAVVQRYLTTKDEAASARSIWMNALLTIPASLIFFGIGTALFSYYKSHPENLYPGLNRIEALFPMFIVQQLPSGLAGLLIAGVFAASMSSLDSAMNSVSAAVTTDFYRRFKEQVSEAACLKVARIATVAVGVLGTVFAVGMAHTDVKSLWDQFAFFLGLFGGGLAGIFLLAIFTRRAHGTGAVIALIGSGAVQFLLIQFTSMNKWFFAFTGLFSCLLIGYLSSLIVPGKEKDDEGLTIYTLKQ